MVCEPSVDKPRWHVLNYVHNGSGHASAARTVEQFNTQHHTEMQVFAPTYVVREERDGAVRMKKARLAFHYVFVRDTFDNVKALCCETNGFSFLIDRSSSERRYATVTDTEMASFRAIARAYENCLPYYPLDAIDLEEGDLVEVVNGDFPGLVGTFVPRPKSKSGNIVLQVYGGLGTIAYNIKVSDVRVLEFSKKTTRANDQIDAFVPHLLKALRHYHADEALPESLAAKLAVFCQRMDVARLSSPKLDAKLQVLLYAANHLLGNAEGTERHRERYESLCHHITNPWTQALAYFIISVTERAHDDISLAALKIQYFEPSSKLQKWVISESMIYTRK